jgi:ferrochelatase
MHRDGHRRIVTIVTSAYASYSGCRQYRENLAQALTETGLAAEMEIVKIRPYSEQAGFAEPFATGVSRALHTLATEGTDIDETHVLFTTHSIPVAQALSSGPEYEQRGNPPGLYERQHLDAAARVMKAVAASREAVPTWSLAFQSRSGPPQVPWLGPDVREAMSELANSGTGAAITVPIGFVSDHVEVLWDLDHEAAATADRVGLAFLRVRTPGTDPAFVAMLADLVHELVSGTPQEHDAIWPGLCSLACCPNPRVDMAAVAGC